jgi:hypothetical protein
MDVVGKLRRMPLVKITGHGLWSITALTTVLWGCIFLERLTVEHARENGLRALEQIRVLQMKRHAQPAASPGRHRSDIPSVG